MSPHTHNHRNTPSLFKHKCNTLYWLRSLQSSLSALPSPTMHCAHLGPSPEGSVTSLSLCSSVPSQTEMEPSYVFPLPPSANRCLIALLCARS